MYNKLCAPGFFGLFSLFMLSILKTIICNVSFINMKICVKSVYMGLGSDKKNRGQRGDTVPKHMTMTSKI